MARQFEVFRTAGGTAVVVLQSDLLAAMRTRVVAPLLPPGAAGPPLGRLTPEVEIGGRRLVLLPQLAATLTLAELGRPVASLAGERDAILRAVDMLVSGV